MCAKYSVFCEPPTTYKRDYITHDFVSSIKSPSVKVSDDGLPDDFEKSHSRPNTFTTYDTLQSLDYNLRIPFNALWESAEPISIDIKPLDKQRFRKNERSKDTVKTMPKVYMPPAISLDKTKDSESRELLINFIYKTTINHTNKEVWGDFRQEHSHLANEASDDKTQHASLYDIPPGLRNVASTWDRLQERGFNKFESRNVFWKRENNKTAEVIQELKEKEDIERFIKEEGINFAYDKFPFSYSGHRPRIALGTPLEKRKWMYDHPNSTVFQVAYGRNT